MPSRVFVSTLAAAVATVSYTVSNVAQIYWLNSPISLYGQFLFFLLFLALLSWAQLAALALWRRDAGVLLPHHDVAQRRFFCCGRLCARSSASAPPASSEPLLLNSGVAQPPAAAPPSPLFSLAFFSRFSDAELLFLLGINNGFAALLQWYATPPTRTPPLLNSLIPALAVFFCIPLSKVLMGDTRVFLAPLPALSLAAIVAGLAVGLLPSVIAGGSGAVSGGGAEAPWDVLSWTLINVVSQLPSAGALVGIQALLLRNPGSQRLTIMRFLAFNQVGVATLLLACVWVDFLPWFGTAGSTPSSLGAAVAGAFRCSLLGPAGGDPHCSPLAPLWALLGLAPYLLYLAAMAVVSSDSAVYGNVISVVQVVVQTAFFLIPGTNPDAQATPVWSTLLGVALSMGGVALYKTWEMAEEDRAERAGDDICAGGAVGEEGGDATALLRMF
jgi:hypothetical protein